MRHQEGSNDGVRGSALWGSGGRTGESRQSALWGKGGRRVVLALVAILMLAFPLVADASLNAAPKPAPAPAPGPAPVAKPTPAAPVTPGPSYISPDLAKKAKAQPGESVRVIVQSTDGSSAAGAALHKVMGTRVNAAVRHLDLVGGASMSIPAAKLNDLLKIKGLTITPDAPVKLSGADDPYQSRQLWANETGNSFGWGNKDHAAIAAPTIAFVDSGIDANRQDFDYGARVVANVNMTTLPGNSAGDGRGHGTFVAGIAAGSALNVAGASPTSNIAMLDVMDDQGMARTSDVIAAAGWILANKAKYNIRVANFSLHSTTPSNFTRDPLDKAVESLWFGGVTVVVAAGNYGTGATPSGVLYAPGNDPFVITVGALDAGTSGGTGDDRTAPWSAWGSTYDGFMKPEISAPGRYMVGPVQAGSTLMSEKPENIVAASSLGSVPSGRVGPTGAYMQLSGTSFSAPVVAGTAAQVLAAHPTYTPDQVKGDLMATARKLDSHNWKYSGGVGLVTASQAINFDPKKTPPNPNVALDRYIKADGYGGYSFDGTSWYQMAKLNPAWDSTVFQDVSWSNVSWRDDAWQDVSWSNVSWHDVSWNDMMSAADSTQADGANGDGRATQVVLSDTEIAKLLCDPYLNPFPPISCSVSLTPLVPATISPITP